MTGCEIIQLLNNGIGLFYRPETPTEKLYRLTNEILKKNIYYGMDFAKVSSDISSFTRFYFDEGKIIAEPLDDIYLALEKIKNAGYNYRIDGDQIKRLKAVAADLQAKEKAITKPTKTKFYDHYYKKKHY